MAAALKVFDLLNNGYDFKNVAIDNSTDSATAADGGDLGWVEEDDPFVPAPILQAAKILGISEISNRLKSMRNIILCGLVDFKQNNKGTMEEIDAALTQAISFTESSTA